MMQAGNHRSGTTYSLQACRVGTLMLPGWECFFAVNDCNFYPCEFYIWIVRGEGIIGLIDTGLPLDPHECRALIDACQRVDKRCKFTDIVTVDKLIAKHGITPTDIDFVILTQPITYHSGGLEPEYFPRADVYMSRAGVMEMLLENVGHPPRSAYFTIASWAFLRELLLENRLTLTDDPVEVRPGIVFETTGGHHPGSGAVRIQTAEGIVGILETAFLQRNIDELCPIGVAENTAICREAIRRYKLNCNVAVAIHDPKNAERFTG